MRAVLLDANVVLSAITDRNRHQQKTAEELFRAAARSEFWIAVPQFVLFEVSFVLENLYGRKQQEIANLLRELIALPGVMVIHELAIVQWLDLWSGRIPGAVDAALATLALTHRWPVATFDRRLSRQLRRLGVAIRDQA